MVFHIKDMNKEAIREYLIDFQKKELPKLIKREFKITDSKKIKSIIGPRRAGKTYFMYQKIGELLEKGINKGNILYLNFEDPKLFEIDFKEVKDIIKLNWELYPESTKKEMHIFIDEPQNIERWEIAVRSLHDEGFNIFISGSSSKLLSKEIATSLRGRTLSYLILPFSFKDFINIKNLKFDVNMLSSREKSILLNLMNEYLEFGGFPEVINEKENNDKLKTIAEYFDLVLYKDIADRNNLKNTKLIKRFMRSLLSSFSKEFSIHKQYNILKSKGVNVSKNTLYNYMSMIEDSFFVFTIPKFNYSINKSELMVSKVYLADVSFSKLIEFSRDIGKKMENVAFLEIYRRRKIPEEIYYWADAFGEVDFVIKEELKIKQLIQVCLNMEDQDTREREINSLLKASNELKCNNLWIITEDKEGEENIKGKKIIYKPLWKFLLGEEKI